MRIPNRYMRHDRYITATNVAVTLGKVLHTATHPYRGVACSALS